MRFKICSQFFSKNNKSRLDYKLDWRCSSMFYEPAAYMYNITFMMIVEHSSAVLPNVGNFKRDQMAEHRRKKKKWVLKMFGEARRPAAGPTALARPLTMAWWLAGGLLSRVGTSLHWQRRRRRQWQAIHWGLLSICLLLACCWP
jgi:hypothetical protein